MKKNYFLVLLCTLLTFGGNTVWGAITPLNLPQKWADDDGTAAYTENLGCSLTSVSSYGSAPKLKFDKEGSCLLIQLADSPDKITFNFKQNGSNSGTFEVQESADGSDYTTADAVKWPGANKSSVVEVSLKPTSLYIKLLYSQKGNSTNVGIGGISITKAKSSVPCTITLIRDGGVYDKLTESTAGEGVVLPTPTDVCDDYTFIGWCSDDFSTGTAKPSIISAGAYSPTDNCMLYAVYGRVETGGSITEQVEVDFTGGGKDVLTENSKVTQSGLGTDYSDKTYGVKLDNTGDYILLSLDNIPLQIQLTVKMIGGASNSSIAIQEAESKDGTFSTIETFSISGTQNKVISYVSSQTYSHKYIRLYFTKGSNVGLGKLYVKTQGVTSTTTYTSAPNCGAKQTAVSLIQDLENVTCQETITEINKDEQDITLNYTANEGYRLPKTIEVKVGEQILSKEKYEWEDGMLVLQGPFDNDVTVRIAGAKLYKLNEKLSGVTAKETNPTEIAADDADVTLEYSLSEGYAWPTSIEVKIGDKAVSPDKLVWDEGEGVLIIEGPFDGNVSVSVTAINQSLPQLETPASLAQSNIRATSVTLTWKQVEGAGKYRVYITDNDSYAREFYTEVGTNNTLDILDLTPATQYGWTVLAIGDNQTYRNSEKSNESGFSTLALVESPKIGLQGGNYKGAQSVSITCTTDGATIYYTLDGTVPTTESQKYTGPVKISKSCTLKARAYNDGMEESAIVSEQYFVDLGYAETIADFIAFAVKHTNGYELRLTEESNAVITGIKGTTIYLQDATRGIMIYGLTDLPEDAKVGKKIVGNIKGKYKLYNQQDEIIDPELGSEEEPIRFIDAIRPTPVVVNELSETSYAAHPMMLVTLEGVFFQSTQVGEINVGYVVKDVDGNEYYVFNTFGMMTGKILPDNSTKCNVSGILVNYKGKYEILPVEKTDINTLDAQVEAPTFAPQGGSDEASAVQLTDNKVAITPATNTTIKVGEEIATTVTIVTIKQDGAITVVASRDFYTDRSVTYYYKVNQDVVRYDIKGLTSDKNGNQVVATVEGEEGNQTSSPRNKTITLTYTTIAHYSFKSIAVKGADGQDIVVTKQENGTITFTMPEQDVTVMAVFEEDAKYAITFDVNGAETTIDGMQKYENEEITLPTIKRSGFFFRGWESGGNIYEAGEKFFVPAENVTFTAQWENKPSFDNGVWQMVTTTEDITKGSYIIIAASSANVAMQSWSSGNNCKTVQVTQENDVLTYELTDAKGNPSVPAIYEIQEGTQDGTYSFFDVETEQYIYAASSSSNSLKGQSNKDDNASWKISYNENNVVSVVAQGTYKNSTMQYNNSASAFSCYSSASQKPIALYKFIKGAYIISFDANGGDLGECPAKAVAKDGKLTISTIKPTFARDEQATEAKAFTSWNDKQDGNGNMYEAGKEYTFTVPTTLYAQWGTKPLHSVTYVAVGAAGTIPTDTKRYCEGEDVLLKAADNLSNVGYVFSGWKVTATDGTEVTVTNRTFTMPDADVIASAQWVRKSAGKYVLVTDKSQLVAGQQYVIACNTKDAVAGDIRDNKYLSKVDAKFSQDKSRIYDIQGNAVLFTLGSTETEGSYTLACEEGQYLTISNGDVSWNTVATEWSIEINGVAIIKNGNNNCIKYNYSASPARFKTYGSSAQNVSAIQLYQFIPAVIISDYRDVSTSALMEGADVTIEDGGTLYYSAAEEYTLGDIHVLEGGKLQLDGESKLTAQDFYINTTMGAGKSGQMIGATNSNFSVQGDAYIDITLGKNGDPNQWHAFTVPFPVDAMNGVYDLNNNQLTNEVNYAIMDYHGDIRAKGQYGWKKYRGILNPGTFYLMTVDGERTTYRFKKTGNGALVDNNEMQLHEYAANGEGTDTDDAGWNGVGNMTLAYGKANIDGITEVQVLNPETYTYEVKQIADVAFTVGTPFFVQAAADGVMSMAQQNGSRLYAPARQAAKTVSQYGVHFGNADYMDVLYISASEDATNTYQIGKDLVKMTMSDAPVVSQIFAEAYGNMLCVMYAPLSNNEAVFPLNLYAPKAGEYTISADEAQGETLYLMQGDNVVWNLTLGEYTLDLEQGANEGYSILLKAPHVTTDFNPVMDGNGELVEKVFLHNNLYIIRGGKMYDATGKMVSDK